nr:NAC domain-containing protein [Tanacetum cinerariifolium]
MDFQNEINRLQDMLNLINSNQDPSVNLYDLKGSDKGDNEIDSLTKEPSDTFLIGDECDMPVNSPLPTTDVREEDFDINSPLGKYVVDFLMENVDIAELPRHLVKQLFSHLVRNPSLTKRMSDEPLGDDSKPRSYDVTLSNPLFDFNDDYNLCYDNPFFDEEFKDISNLDPFEPTLVIDESNLIVTPLPASKPFSLREVERFDPFFSLT